MKRPERKINPDNYDEHYTGYNQACKEWIAYIKSIGGRVECILLHKKGCQCENDE